jgi:hypothetical protein
VSIVIPTGQSRTGIALESTAVRRSGQQMRRSRPLAALTLVSYWIVTGILGVAAWYANARDDAWAAALLDARGARDAAADAAAGRAELAWRIGWLAVVLAVVATALWSLALARNARTRGVPNVRPGRVAGAWFVPLAGPPKAIRHIGRFLREFDYSERRLWFWLFALHVETAVLLMGQIVVFIGFHVSVEDPTSLDLVHRQTQVLWLQSGMSGVLALLATRAILHADNAVSRVSVRTDAGR